MREGAASVNQTQFSLQRRCMCKVELSPVEKVEGISTEVVGDARVWTLSFLFPLPAQKKKIWSHDKFTHSRNVDPVFALGCTVMDWVSRGAVKKEVAPEKSVPHQKHKEYDPQPVDEAGKV